MKGVRPQSFADAILEVAAKKHMQLQIFSEFEFRRHKAFNRDTEMLSAFSDPLRRYDVKCPSGKYVRDQRTPDASPRNIFANTWIAK